MLLDEPRLLDALGGPERRSGAGPWTGSLPLGPASSDDSSSDDSSSDTTSAAAPEPTPPRGTSRITLEPAEGSPAAMRLHVLPSRPASAPEILEQLRTVTGLLAFAHLETTPSLTFRARIDGEDGEGGEDRGTREHRWVTCCAPGPHIRWTDGSEADPGQPLFTAEELPFSELLTAWSSLRTRHSTALAMLLAGTTLPDEFQEAAMLALLGSAEALFATSAGLRRREIKDSTLRRKLEHLAARVSFDDVMGTDRSAALWAEQAARLRSTFTHSGRVDPGSDAELRLLAQLTAGVVVLTLLHELGIPAGKDRHRLGGSPLLRDAVPPRPEDPVPPRDRPPASAPPGLVGGLPTPRDLGGRPHGRGRRAS